MNKTKLYSPVKHSVVSLISMLHNDKESLTYISDSLKTRGYAFVRLPVEFTNQVDDVMTIMETFFLNNPSYKKKFSKKPIFGYFGVNHKESYRLLTGSRLTEHTFPENFDKVKNLVHTMDRVMYGLTLLLSPYIFPTLKKDANTYKISLFDSNKPWGMFDVAKYYNDGKRVGLNCEEHYDPGLLSMSFRSSEEGLQLKDEFGKWIKVPVDKTLGVIWAGNAATKINPFIKPGVHRVDCSSVIGKPRISMWYEICTSDQEHTELIKDTKKIAIDFETITGMSTSKSAPSMKIFK